MKQHLERERRLAVLARAQAAWLPPPSPADGNSERQASRGR